MKWLLALALFLFPAWCLAQPVSPNCTTVNATCQAKKFRLIAGNSLCFNSATCTDTITASATTGGMLFNSGVANSGSNVAYAFDTSNALTASTLLLNISNHGVSKASIDNAGNISTFGGITTQGNLAGIHVINTNTSNPLVLLGLVSDGASAIGTIVDQNGALATNGAELLSIRNNGSEVAAFTFRGTLNQASTDLSGAPGSGTANTPIVLAAFAGTSGATITITDAVAKTTSGCLATLQTIDATAKDVACVPGNGSFTLTPNATTTGITKVLAILFNGN